MYLCCNVVSKPFSGVAIRSCSGYLMVINASCHYKSPYRVKELVALSTCDECLDLARELFDTNHSWMKQILRTHDFATTHSQGTNYSDFRIKSSDFTHKEIQNKNRQLKKKIEMQQYNSVRTLKIFNLLESTWSSVSTK